MRPQDRSTESFTPMTLVTVTIIPLVTPLTTELQLKGEPSRWKHTPLEPVTVRSSRQMSFPVEPPETTYMGVVTTLSG